MNEPTAALGVRESGMVLDLIRRLGRRAAVVRPDEVSMADVVGIMTGALAPEQLQQARARGEHPGDDLPGGSS